eukprot:jgi/Chlat1/161/Chrsp1S03103
MVREVITIQVGQCGNQIGCRFWEMVLREHAAVTKNGKFDDALSTFFRNVDTRYEPPTEIPPDRGKHDIYTLKARALLVDMEEGVVNELLTGRLAEIFDSRQNITDVSGSGNNWAHGHNVYGPQYQESLLDKIRQAAEVCDSLQSFTVLHSLGGGTGSGLGSYILGLLHDYFGSVDRFAFSVFPSEDDDVVTSPYNSMLALGQLMEHADAVLPVDNQSLQDICRRIDASGPVRVGSQVSGAASGGKPFDDMNGVAASSILHLTAGMRFEGSLNVDLNEITTNLVPFPRMHFLVPSMAPLAAPKDLGRLTVQPRSIDQVFGSVFMREHQLAAVDPRRGVYSACALFIRGPCTVSDARRNLARHQGSVRMAHWTGGEGFKVGLCAAPPVGLPYSLLCLSNNSAIRGTFGSMRERFMKLYRRRVYVHHYTQYMEASLFDESLGALDNLLHDYEELEYVQESPASMRLTPLGVSLV